MKKLTLFLITLAVCLGQAIAPAPTTYSSLPTASTVPNQLRTVTDCSTSVCTAGGGSIRAVVQSTGSAWAVVGGGGGSTTCFIDLDVNAMRNGGGGADVAGGGWAIQSTGATIFPELFGSTPPTGAITIKNGAASTDYVFKKIPWPRTCTGETGFTANLTFWIPTGGNVKTGLSLVCVAQGTNGENPTFPSQTYSTINATGSTTKSEVATFTFDLSGCSAGNSLFFRLNRDNSVGSNAGDWARYTSGELYK